jgi:hypothetical protein
MTRIMLRYDFRNPARPIPPPNSQPQVGGETLAAIRVPGAGLGAV